MKGPDKIAYTGRCYFCQGQSWFYNTKHQLTLVLFTCLRKKHPNMYKTKPVRSNFIVNRLRLLFEELIVVKIQLCISVMIKSTI